MQQQPKHRPIERRIPTWVLGLLPLAAVAVSNADVVLLAMLNPREESGSMTFALMTTIPLSLAAGGLTLWFILRLGREVDRRRLAESDLRASMADLRMALDREHLLRRELDHRVRNNLSALLALIGLYEQTDARPDEVMRSLRGKILALRESYCLLAATHGGGIALRELLLAVITAILGDPEAKTIEIEGPEVRLTSREANAYAMIVQELLTNASKHGALRHTDGRISITWDKQFHADECRVTLRWSEHPVEPAGPSPPSGRLGTGLSLIEGLAACDLRGGMSFGKTQNRWSVELVANLKSHPGAAPLNPAPPVTPLEILA